MVKGILLGPVDLAQDMQAADIQNCPVESFSPAFTITSTPSLPLSFRRPETFLASVSAMIAAGIILIPW